MCIPDQNIFTQRWHGARLGHVVVDVHKAAVLDRAADNREAHIDDLARRRAVVARAHVALERGRHGAARVVEVCLRAGAAPGTLT